MAAVLKTGTAQHTCTYSEVWVLDAEQLLRLEPVLAIESKHLEDTGDLDEKAAPLASLRWHLCQ